MQTMTKKERSLREATFPRCQEHGCNNVAGLGQTHCGAHRSEIITIRYETDAMHCLRQMLTTQGFSDEDVDTFKGCLIALERNGFTLMRKFT